jgi:alcohol dehydrogenase class IV
MGHMIKLAASNKLIGGIGGAALGGIAGHFQGKRSYKGGDDPAERRKHMMANTLGGAALGGVGGGMLGHAMGRKPKAPAVEKPKPKLKTQRVQKPKAERSKKDYNQNTGRSNASARNSNDANDRARQWMQSVNKKRG